MATPEQAYPKLVPVIQSLRVDNPDATDDEIHQAMGQFVKASVDAHKEMGLDHAGAIKATADKFGISEPEESHPVWGAVQKYINWASDPKQVGKDVLDTAKTIANPTDSIIGRMFDKATGIPAYAKAREFGEMNRDTGLNIIRSGTRNNTGSYEDLSTKKTERPFTTGDAASIGTDASGGFDRLPLNAADLIGQLTGAEPDSRVSPTMHGIEQTLMAAGMARGMQGSAHAPESAPYRRPVMHGENSMPELPASDPWHAAVRDEKLPPNEPLNKGGALEPESLQRPYRAGQEYNERPAKPSDYRAPVAKPIEQPVSTSPLRNAIAQAPVEEIQKGGWEGLSPDDKAELRSPDGTVKGDLEQQRMATAKAEADSAQGELDKLLPEKPASPIGRVMERNSKPAALPANASLPEKVAAAIGDINGAKNEWQLKQVLDKHEPMLKEAATQNPEMAGKLREIIADHESEFKPSKTGKYGPASVRHSPEIVEMLRNEKSTYRRIKHHEDMGAFRPKFEDTAEMNRDIYPGGGMKGEGFDEQFANDKTPNLGNRTPDEMRAALAAAENAPKIAPTERTLEAPGTPIERSARPEIPDVPEGVAPEDLSSEASPEYKAQRDAERSAEAKKLARSGTLEPEQNDSILERIQRRLREHEYDVGKRMASQPRVTGNPLQRLLKGEERGALSTEGGEPGIIRKKLAKDWAHLRDEVLPAITNAPGKLADAFEFARKTPKDLLGEIYELRGDTSNYVKKTVRDVRAGKMPNGWTPNEARAHLKQMQNDAFDRWAGNLDEINAQYRRKGDKRLVTLSEKGGYGPLAGKEVSPDFKKHLDAYQNFVKESDELAKTLGFITRTQKFVRVGLRAKAIPKQFIENTIAQHLADNNMLSPYGGFRNFRKYYVPAFKDIIADIKGQQNDMVDLATKHSAYGSMHEGEIGQSLSDKLEKAQKVAESGDVHGFIQELADLKELYGKAYDLPDNLSKLATFRKGLAGELAPDHWFMRDEAGKLRFNEKAAYKRKMTNQEIGLYVNDHFVNFNDKSSALSTMTSNRTGAALVFDPYLTSKWKMMGVYGNALKRNPLRTLATMAALSKVAKDSYDSGRGELARYHQFPSVVTAKMGDTYVDLNSMLSGTELLEGFRPFVENPSGSKAGNTVKGLLSAATNFAMTGPYSIYNRFKQSKDEGTDPLDDLKAQGIKEIKPLEQFFGGKEKVGAPRAALKEFTGIDTYKADTNEMVAKSKNDKNVERGLNSAMSRTKSLYYKDISNGMSDEDAMRRANKRIQILTGKKLDFADYLSAPPAP